MFNKHSSDYWSDNNPNAIRIRNFEGKWNFKVYCAKQNNGIVYLQFYEKI